MHAFTVGELIGFSCIPVLGGLVAWFFTAGLDDATRALLLYAIAVVGGFAEGAVLAACQFPVLRERLPGLSRRRWLGWTGAAAALAWALGMLPSTLDELVGLSGAVQVAIWVPAVVLILLSIGAAQAWVLRRLVRRPGRWVVANAVGWLAGLPWTFVLPALVPDGAAVQVWFAAFAVAAVLMGLSAGAVTGLILPALVPAVDAAEAPPRRKSARGVAPQGIRTQSTK